VKRRPKQNLDISGYDRTLQRICEDCGTPYTIGEFVESCEDYFRRPYDYRAGCERYCLRCWLGVGPLDFPSAAHEQEMPEYSPNVESGFQISISLGDDERYTWPYEDAYENLVEGNILEAFAWYFERGYKLAVLPISRLHVNRPAFFPCRISFYPPRVIEFKDLCVVPNRGDAESAAERSSYASGVTDELLNSQSLVVVPCRFDWNAFRGSSHEAHVDLIRQLSEEIDRICLDFVRYRLCRIEPIERLPGRAGQIEGTPMIAGALAYSHEDREARTVGGAAFSHVLTRGLGLTMRQLEWNDFPADGEVGHIVEHGLSLYTALLEANNPTARFMQALSLLEFLAYPDEYHKFEEVKKVIARYVARDSKEYQRLLDRFFELTGKKDPESGRIIGYRTRIVHMGEKLEKLVTAPKSRKGLFLELDTYIRQVLDHMIEHSEMSFEDYLKVREEMKPFER